MSGCTAQDVAGACRGRLVRGAATTGMRGVCTDSRALSRGDLFIALRGERFDGHDFVADAAAKGASIIVCADDVWEQLPNGVAVVVVDDTLRALGALAAAHRRRHSLPVMAVTGSTGKTTTKEMLRHILDVALPPALATEGTENNEIGVPLTLLRLTAQHRAAALEFAMRGPGEIAYLTRIAAPTVGVVTNVGASHVGRLGSVCEIAAAKAELIVGLDDESTAVLNADDPMVARMRDDAPGRVLTFGMGGSADIRCDGAPTSVRAGITFDMLTPEGRREVALHVLGQHNVYNALAAAAAALAVSASLSDIAAGLGEFQGLPGRGRVMSTDAGLTLIDDSYNASPDSTHAALDLMQQHRGSGRAIVVFGDMLELGGAAAEAHRGVGADMAAHGVDLVFALGEHADDVVQGAASTGGDTVARSVDDKASLLAQLRAEVHAGDTVLVKGSRSMGMEDIVRGLAGD